MSINLGQNIPVTTPVNSVNEAVSAKLSKNQQEIEGQLALQLIQSVTLVELPAPVGNIGNQINTKA